MGLTLISSIDLVRFGLATPPGQDCGGISHSHLERADRADAVLQPLVCFWQAYQTCRAATSSQTYSTGMESGFTDTLTIEMCGDRCAIYGQERGYDNGDTQDLPL